MGVNIVEKFDLYNDERILLDKVLERGQKCDKGENRMVIHICIFNSKGEMLIQQRQSFKQNWANMWDISLGGCSIAGEASKESAHRELLEELGIDYDFTDNRPYFTINFDNGFDDFYFIEQDIDINNLTLQAEEVQAIKWATKEEILRLREKGQFIPYYESFLLALFDLRTKRGLY